jgi:hypothetical protein
MAPLSRALLLFARQQCMFQHKQNHPWTHQGVLVSNPKASRASRQACVLLSNMDWASVRSLLFRGMTGVQHDLHLKICVICFT